MSDLEIKDDHGGGSGGNGGSGGGGGSCGGHGFRRFRGVREEDIAAGGELGLGAP